MCIQLKRFDYDWETNQALKFDDYFEFPIELNVEPFTYHVLNNLNSDINCEYELCGVVVHSGKANAGHYYSFIKEYNFSDLAINEENKLADVSRWFKFNDTHIDEVTVNANFLAEECFGGTFVKKDSIWSEKRTRYWNAYMLFYRQKAFNPNSICKEYELDNNNYDKKVEFRDSISELSNLVEQCDNKVKNYQLENEIRIENLNLLKQHLIINQIYFDFIYNLIDQNLDLFPKVAIHLGFNFLFFIYFKLNRKLRNSLSLSKWFELFDSRFSEHIFTNLVEFFNQQNNFEMFKVYLLDNSADKEVNSFMCKLVLLIIKRLDSDSQQPCLFTIVKNISSLVTNSLLNINLNYIFEIVYNYVCIKDENCAIYFKEDKTFSEKLLNFILQNSIEQLQNYHFLFEIVSLLALANCDYESLLFNSDKMIKQVISKILNFNIKLILKKNKIKFNIFFCFKLESPAG